MNSTKDGDVIVFDSKTVMHHAAPAFFSRIFIVEDNPHELRNLFDRLGEKGMARCFFLTVRNGYIKEFNSFSPAVTWDTLAADTAAECCISEFYLFTIPLQNGTAVSPQNQREPA